MEDKHDTYYLLRRVNELEEKIALLRISRRVLMNLLERLEKDRCLFEARLKRENKRLQRDKCKYARLLMVQNRRIVELENRLNRNQRDPAN